ncbi:lipase family alpha/beta hydrolase [Ketobacter alkanivorans]|nr:triacylglycerol lipase [Ketobacter alkanivorans]
MKTKKQMFLSVLSLTVFLFSVIANADEYAKTRYPIVLVHGTFGFDKIGPIDYWYGIPQDMAKHGADVHVVQVSPFGLNEMRGEQLLVEIETILAITGADKVNLIGHSQGGPTVRYAAGVAPEKVASVTTIGSPTFGTKAVDLVISALDTPVIGVVVDGVMELVTSLYNRLLETNNDISLPRDPRGTLYSLSTIGATEFNANYPAGVPLEECGEGEPVVDGVRYYSWSGTKPFNNYFDPADYVFALTATLFPTENDGLVERCGSHLGTVIRDDYRMNHLDEINHFFGMVGMFNPNPKALFRQHANRLKLQGL